MADPLSIQDVATMSGITTARRYCVWWYKLDVGFDLIRSLGCSSLSTGEKFTLVLGTDSNILSYSLPDSQLKAAIKLKTDGGFVILINQQPICDFGQDLILCMSTHRYGSSFIQECEESG